jgi:redox-sensitive bicupin YhaK (pirin superfamily)
MPTVEGAGVQLERLIGQSALRHLDPFVLLATGRPLNEPIVQRGPFVMNSDEEIRRAFEDYRSGVLEGA